MILMMMCIIATLSLINPHNVAVWSLASIGHETAVLGIIALGALMVFHVNEYDLSLGATFAFSLMTFSMLSNTLSPFIAMLLIIPLVGVIGFVNGIISVTVGSTLVVTFTMMFIIRGVVFFLCDGMPSTSQPGTTVAVWESLGWGEVWGLPTSILVFLALVGALEAFFRRSTTGRNLIAIGLGGRRARFCGISTRHYKIFAFIFAALTALLASTIFYARLNTASPNIGMRLPFDALAIVIISNAGLQRRLPSPSRIFIITILLVIIQHQLEFLGLQPEVSYVMAGILVLSTLLIDLTVTEHPRR